jgi:hypothetical protein
MMSRDSELMMLIVGIIKAKDPPTTVGSRVPNVVWNNVLMPDTNKMV